MFQYGVVGHICVAYVAYMLPICCLVNGKGVGYLESCMIMFQFGVVGHTQITHRLQS